MLSGIFFFAFYILIYTLVDSLNMTYTKMIDTYGLYLVILNITINIVMSLLGSLLMNIGSIQVELKASSKSGTNLGFISVLFGILTYGCTSCVITFFASIGIPFFVVALPLAGFPYKLISLLILILGFMWVIRNIKKSTCTI